MKSCLGVASRAWSSAACDPCAHKRLHVQQCCWTAQRDECPHVSEEALILISVCCSSGSWRAIRRKVLIISVVQMHSLEWKDNNTKQNKTKNNGAATPSKALLLWNRNVSVLFVDDVVSIPLASEITCWLATYFIYHFKVSKNKKQNNLIRSGELISSGWFWR